MRIQVVKAEIVARSLNRLREQRIHTLFAGYLCLQRRASEHRRQKHLPADFVGFFDTFFRVEDHPIGTPYIKPFTDHKPSPTNLWLNENVAGSYAPSSLRADQPFRQVVEIEPDKTYTLRPRHAQLAFQHLLRRKKIPVKALAIFLYRDFAILDASATLEDLVDAFAVDFGYATMPRADRNNDFAILYDTADNSISDDVWTEMLPPAVGPAQGEVKPAEAHPIVSAHPVRHLTAAELLGARPTVDSDQPPIEELRVNGLLSFGEETIFKFGRLNVLVGANGSGKSNLIDCFRIFSEAPRDIQAAFARDGIEGWLHNGLDKQAGSGMLQLTVRIPGRSEALRHQLKLGPPSHGRAQLEELLASERGDSEKGVQYFVGSYRSAAVLSVGTGGARRRREKQLDATEYDPWRSILSQVRDLSQYPEITRVSDLYSGFRIYAEWSVGRESQLRDAAPTGRSDSRLSPSMDDLPVALNALEQTSAHEAILRLLPELKETYRDYVTRILFGRVGLELVEAPFRLPIPAGRLSDGTLRFLAMAAIFLQPNPPPFMCIEEPELGMHPDAIKMVAGMISDAAARSQLIITTHSEHLLTALQDDFDILIAFDTGSAGSRVRSFTRDDFKVWRDEHVLGDLWTSGELGGNRW